MKSLLVLVSYHHNNTEKIANVFAKVLDAQIKTPREINPEELQEFDIIGFGSGIYSDKHHKSVLTPAEPEAKSAKQQPLNGKKENQESTLRWALSYILFNLSGL